MSEARRLPWHVAAAFLLLCALIWIVAITRRAPLFS